MKRMIATLYPGKLLVFSILATLMVFSSCKKGEPDPNFLDGEWDIPLTKVGSETTLYPQLGTYEFPPFDAVVTKNDQGIVNYKIKINPDLTGNPDSVLLQTVIDMLVEGGEFNIDSAEMLDVGIQFRITSKGYQVYSQDGKPQTIVRYDDPVGTTYSFDNIYTNQKIRGAVTEKTGLDDWPMGFLLIKTSKVEFEYPEEFPLIDKVIIRANHRFGLVYAEVKFKNGKSGSIDLIPWDLL